MADTFINFIDISIFKYNRCFHYTFRNNVSEFIKHFNIRKALKVAINND